MRHLRYSYCEVCLLSTGLTCNMTVNYTRSGQTLRQSLLQDYFWRVSPQSAMASSLTTFLLHTQRRTTVGRTPLDEWSSRRIDLYLTTYTKLTTDKRSCPRWDSNPLSQQASARLRPRGHWDRLVTRLVTNNTGCLQSTTQQRIETAHS